MTLTTEDRLDINDVIALHGHLCDAGAYQRFDEVFASDLEVDTAGLGLDPVPVGDPSRPRLDAYIEVARRIGARDNLALHVTNILITESSAGARAWSKGLLVKSDGSVASFSYEDELVRTQQGWRIRRRRVSPRHTPAKGVEPELPTGGQSVVRVP